MICDYCEKRLNCRFFESASGQPFLDLEHCFRCTAPVDIKEGVYLRMERKFKGDPVKISPVFWQDASIVLPENPGDYFVIFRDHVEHSTLYALASYLPRSSGQSDAGWFDLPCDNCEVLYWAGLPSAPVKLEV